MKRAYLCVFVAVLLAACQPQPATATAVPATDTPVAPAVVTLPPIKTSLAPSVSATASSQSTPATHISSPDQNAPNVIVVTDQPVVNGSLTIDSVTAAKSGWVVIYLEKRGQPGHQIGFVAVPSGNSLHVVVPLNQKSGVDVNPSKLAGQQLFVVLQAGSLAPGTPVQVNGRSVLDLFAVLPATKP